MVLVKFLLFIIGNFAVFSLYILRTKDTSVKAGLHLMHVLFGQVPVYYMCYSFEI